MPANSAGSFNVGRDYSFRFVVNSQVFNIPSSLITDVNRKATSHLHEVIPINNDGKPVFRTTYSGYDYEIHFTRQNGQLDLLVDALMQNYYTGGFPPVVTALETARNPDGSVDQFQLLGGAIVPQSLGSFKGADPVNDVHIQIRFAERNAVGGASTSAVNLANATSFL